MKYENLQDCLSDMQGVYKSGPMNAVRSQKFIRCMHDFILDEIEKSVSSEQVEIIRFEQMKRVTKEGMYPRPPINPRKYYAMTEARVFGSHKNKDVDIVLAQYVNGPLLTIGVRSQMSSVGKNILGYYEGIIGECISMHDRFPMSVAGYVYILPKVAYATKKDNSTGGEQIPEEVDLDRAEEMFSQITNRANWRSPNDQYEHFAFIKVDFEANPPQVIPNSNHDLDIDNFIVKMINTHNERNFFNQIRIAREE